MYTAMLRQLCRRALPAVALIATLTMTGCETLPGGGTAPSTARAERLADAGDHDRAAEIYMQLSGLQEGTPRSRYVLLAAQQWMLAEDLPRATAAIAQVPEPTQQPLANDWRITRATLSNLRGDGISALAELAQTDVTQFSLNQRIAAEAARGDALFLTDQPLTAVTILQRRELWLNSREEIENNHQRIWDGLLQSSPDALREALATATDETVAGWLALGMLADGTVAGGPSRGLAGWRRQFSNHPALQFIVPGLDDRRQRTTIGEPQHIALLLHLSGRAKRAGEAVRDGFLSHYAQIYQGQIDAPTIMLYDIDEVGASRAYQHAIEDGADFVVGPLLPTPVEELALGNNLTVPTLFLNYLPADIVPPIEAYQFGLAPEDEAADAANRAWAEGHRRAVAFVPTSDWGKRVLAAFTDQFTALGGELLGSENYIASEPDYKNEIQSLMLLNDSVARYREMRATLGGTLQFEPRRREDVDFIFIGANHDSAKRLKPQFRFHYAGDLPVYATSAVNAVGTPEGNNDLNGIRFAEIPWLVSAMRGEATPLDTMTEYFPAARAQPRLFALGYDALHALKLIGERQSVSEQPDDDIMTTIAGATGDLILELDGSIRRQPQWAVFQSGKTAALPEIQMPKGIEIPIIDADDSDIIGDIDNRLPRN